MKRPRFIVPLALFLLSACDVSFCGPVGGPQGGEGELCRFDGRSAPCNPGLQCDGYNHCQRCGGLDQICCHDENLASIEGCGAGLHCDGATYSCRYCGEVGQSCCSLPLGVSFGGLCDDGMGGMSPTTCAAGRCAAPSGSSTGPTDPTSTYLVGCEHADGCGEMLPVTATSLSSAQDWARGQGCVSTPDGPLRNYVFCVKPGTAARPFDYSDTAFSDDSAMACAQANNHGDLILTGSCESQPPPGTSGDGGM